MSKRPKTFEVGDHVYTVGDRIQAEVPWPNGKLLEMTGTLVHVDGDSVYFTTEICAVVGTASTMEPL